jgi:hypothetical protein
VRFIDLLRLVVAVHTAFLHFLDVEFFVVLTHYLDGLLPFVSQELINGLGASGPPGVSILIEENDATRVGAGIEEFQCLFVRFVDIAI